MAPRTPIESDRQPAIEFRHVHYTLSNRELLNDVSFSVARGETLVLLGRSGAGKTTALKMINRLLVRSSGGRQADNPVGSNRVAAKNRICDPGYWTFPALHRYAKYFADSPARTLAPRPRARTRKGDA